MLALGCFNTLPLLRFLLTAVSLSSRRDQAVMRGVDSRAICELCTVHWADELRTSSAYRYRFVAAGSPRRLIPYEEEAKSHDPGTFCARKDEIEVRIPSWLSAADFCFGKFGGRLRAPFEWL